VWLRPEAVNTLIHEAEVNELLLHATGSGDVVTDVTTAFVNTYCSMLPTDGSLVMRRALRQAESPLTVASWATMCGVPERSLRKLCARNLLPEPRRVIGFVHC